MLKWLRKYNTYILAVGGSLLMIVFLLQGVMTDPNNRLFGQTVFKYAGGRVGRELYQKAGYEFALITSVLGQERATQTGAGENVEHWILLQHEAKEAGFSGGNREGEQLLGTYAGQMARQYTMQMMYAGKVQPQDLDKATAENQLQALNILSKSVTVAAERTGMTELEAYKVLGKLSGVLRMQNAYYNIAQYSDRRLVADSKDQRDAVNIKYVLVPAERELTGIAEPTDAEILAHYERFKSTAKGEGEYGIGYTLPARVKVRWLELNKGVIASAIQADAIEVEKQFLKKYPEGKVPEGVKADDERKRIEQEIVAAQADKVMKAAQQTVQGEIDKMTRKLESDGDFKVVPANFAETATPLSKIAQSVASRLGESEHVNVPAPMVVSMDQVWMDEKELGKLPGIGRTYLPRGQNRLPFSRVALSVREIAGKGDVVLQTMLPSAEPLVDAAGNVYFFTVVEARKASPPDNMSEIHSQIVADYKRLKAYEILKGKAQAIKDQAIAGGLEALAQAPEGATGSLAIPLKIEESQVDLERFYGANTILDTADFRKVVIDVARTNDPAKDVATAPAQQRISALPIDNAMSVAVFSLTKIIPLTFEDYRLKQDTLLGQVRSTEMKADPSVNPFSYDIMRERLNVKFDRADNDRKTTEKKPAAKA